MSKPRILRLTTWVWGILGLNVALIVLLADWQISAANLVWALWLILWWLASFAMIASLIPILYRAHLGTRRFWLALVGCCALGALIQQQVIRIPLSGFNLLGLLLFLYGVWALIVSVALRMIGSDIGLPVVAWLSISAMWGVVTLWRIQGQLIEPLFQMHQSTQPSPVWFLTVLWGASCCLVPAALLSVAWHSLVLLRRELRQLPPPQIAGDRFQQ